MSDVLFIKTSSLGDVIHHMPALTEAKRHRPDTRFAWVVEELFAPLVALHPAVAEVIPVAARCTVTTPKASVSRPQRGSMTCATAFRETCTRSRAIAS